MKQIKVLVFPCGSEVGLELASALRDIPFITLIGASSVPDHGKYVFADYVEGLPFITAPDFLDKFNALLLEREVDFVYPAMDQVIDVLSEHRAEIAAELIAPAHDAVRTCRSKARTYERLAGLDFMPKTYENADEVDEFPVIIKPEEGYGAKGFKVLNNAADLRREVAACDYANVICEYLPGEEYTVDCFTDRHGELKYISCRNRGRIRSGISVHSETQPQDARIREIALKISEKIEMRGAWFFQLKRDAKGEYKLMEAATRVAGTMCLNRAKGVNLPLLTLFDFCGYDVEITPQFGKVEVDRALYNVFRIDRKFSEVYVDFDDTLIVHGRVNGQLMRYLYQCIDDGIPVKMLTKHDGDLKADMYRARISEQMFDEIIHISPTGKKFEHVCPAEGALLIDDSFAERREMQQHFSGISAVGVDAVEVLIDHRR